MMSQEVKHEYIDYLERLQACGDNKDKSLLELHQTAIAKEIALSYGVSEDEYDNLSTVLAELQSA